MRNSTTINRIWLVGSLLLLQQGAPGQDRLLTGTAAELDMQGVKQDDYFLDFVLDVLGENTIKAQPFH